MCLSECTKRRPKCLKIEGSWNAQFRKLKIKKKKKKKTNQCQFINCACKIQTPYGLVYYLRFVFILKDF